jgi:hypothetical protein
MARFSFSPCFPVSTPSLENCSAGNCSGGSNPSPSVLHVSPSPENRVFPGMSWFSYGPLRWYKELLASGRDLPTPEEMAASYEQVRAAFCGPLQGVR